MRVEQGLHLAGAVGRGHDHDQRDGSGGGHRADGVDEHRRAVQCAERLGCARTEAHAPAGGRNHGRGTEARSDGGFRRRGTRIVRHRFLSGLCARPSWVWPQRAGRDALTGPFRDIWSRQLRGPGTPSARGSGNSGTGQFRFPDRVRVRTCRSARRQLMRHRAPRHFIARISNCTALTYAYVKTATTVVSAIAYVGTITVSATAGVRTREPRRAGPRPCPRSCSPRERARSPGSGGPWRACASHRRRVHARAHDATGHVRLPRP